MRLAKGASSASGRAAHRPGKRVTGLVMVRLGRCGGGGGSAIRGKWGVGWFCGRGWGGGGGGGWGGEKGRQRPHRNGCLRWSDRMAGLTDLQYFSTASPESKSPWHSLW